LHKRLDTSNPDVKWLHGMSVCGPCIPLLLPFAHPSPPPIRPPFSPSHSPTPLSLPFTYPSPSTIRPPLSPLQFTHPSSLPFTRPTPLPSHSPTHPPSHSHIEESAAPALLDLSLPPTPSAETQKGTNMMHVYFHLSGAHNVVSYSCGTVLV